MLDIIDEMALKAQEDQKQQQLQTHGVQLRSPVLENHNRHPQRRKSALKQQLKAVEQKGKQQQQKGKQQQQQQQQQQQRERQAEGGGSWGSGQRGEPRSSSAGKALKRGNRPAPIELAARPDSTTEVMPFDIGTPVSRLSHHSADVSYDGDSAGPMRMTVVTPRTPGGGKWAHMLTAMDPVLSKPAGLASEPIVLSPIRDTAEEDQL